MTMQLSLFQSSDDRDWDRFVAASANGTFMHTRRFLGYHPEGRFADHSLLFRHPNGTLAAVLPAAVREEQGRHVLNSHPGSTYGGIVVPAGLAMEDADEIARLLVAHARGEGMGSIFMRLPERALCRAWCEEIDAALFRAGFAIIGREISRAFRLTGLSEEDILARFDAKNGARKVRMARKAGISMREVSGDRDYAEFWPIVERNLSDRHGAKPTHTLEEILRLKRLMGDAIVLLGAYREGRMIGGALLFVLNDAGAFAKHFAIDFEHEKLGVSRLVVYESLLACRRRGLACLNYGISTTPGTLGLELNLGLDDFKRWCGGEGVTRDLIEKRLDASGAGTGAVR
jgi:hypothetical protein